MSNHTKPKGSSPIYSASRMVLLGEPWLTYQEVHEKNMTRGTVGTVSAYGAAIREEIGCELHTEGGVERLVVDYPKYAAACKKYFVLPRTKEDLVAHGTRNRPIKFSGLILDDLPPPTHDVTQAMLALTRSIHDAANERISALHPDTMIFTSAAASHAKPDDFVGIPVSVGEELTRRMEAAELRSTEANNQLKLLETQLTAARKEANEAAHALKILDDLASAPVSVIRAILG